MRSRYFIKHLFLLCAAYHFFLVGLIGADYYGYETWWGALGLIGLMMIFIYLAKFLLILKNVYRSIC